VPNSANSAERNPRSSSPGRRDWAYGGCGRLRQSGVHELPLGRRKQPNTHLQS